MYSNSFLSSMSTSARMGLFTGLGILVALTAALLWWLYTPNEQLLFGNLRESDAAEIVQSLNEWKVPHTITDDGTSINVAGDAVYETRMRLVSAGVPHGGHVGFELFDDSDFGVTEFAQRVNFQRALQGEIERTIAALPGVESSRVHLTIRRPGLFLSDKEDSKASVALALRPGWSLSRQQISGIRNLVAAAVEGLAAEHVAILGSDGALLAGANEAGESPDLAVRWEEKAQLEHRIQARIAELLRQVLHDEEFRVSVDVSLNFDEVHQVSERPLGGSGETALARKRVSYGAGEPDGSGGPNQEESEYVHGKAREEISRALGRIERLSVAVILPPQLDEAEVSRLRSLIEAAAGIEIDRGDQLEVSRVGRERAWPTQVPPPAASSTRDSTAPDSLTIGVEPAAHKPSVRLAWKWLVVGALGLLVGGIVGVSLHQRPRPLRSHEREAMLNRMRGWLAEGDAVP